MGTALLPVRELKDDEVSLDVIDVDIEPGEKVEDLTITENPHYRVAKSSSRELAMTGGRKHTTVLAKDVRAYKYRLATVEIIDSTDGTEEETKLMELPTAFEEAEVVQTHEILELDD